jgi:hypothetical protein
MLMTTVQYAEDKFGPYVKFRKDVARHGIMQVAPGQGSDGYGMKIVSDWMIRFEGEKKAHRVYITQISNAGSAWIEKNGEKYFLRDIDYVETVEK